MKIQAAVARKPHADMDIESVFLRAEDLYENEILVRVKASGVCHTDIIIRDVPPDMELPYPICPKPTILGHEGAGVVERVGAGVEHVKPGDRVLMSFHYDGECGACLENMQQYCERYTALNNFGTTPAGGHHHFDRDGSPLSMMHHQSSFATHMLATRENTYLIPHDIAFEYAAPIGCGLMTGAGGVKNLLQVKPGSSIAVFGCGAVGLGAIAAASREGCEEIIAIDLEPGRLDIARDAGATRLIDASTCNVCDAIRETHPMGVRYSFDATGVPAVIGQAISILSTRGECAIFGGAPDPAATTSFQSNMLLFGKSIYGGFMGHSNPAETINYVFDLIRSGTIPMSRMVKTFPFAAINEAVASASEGVVKPVVLMP